MRSACLGLSVVAQKLVWATLLVNPGRGARSRHHSSSDGACHTNVRQGV